MAYVIDHDERDHARFAPSAIHRLFNCIGSLEAGEEFPDPPPSAAATEGTECHEAADAYLSGRLSYEKATRGLTEEQEWIVSEYVDVCEREEDRLIRKHGQKNVTVYTEQKVYAPRIHEDFHGTCDRSMIAGRHFHIIDLKAGFHPVEVEYAEMQPWGSKYNPQLLSYALLSVHHHKLFKLVDWVYLTIVQPRVYGEPQQVRIHINELREFQREVVKLIRLVLAGDDSRRAGPWCKFCKAAGACPANRKRVNQLARNAFADNQEKAIRNYKPEEYMAILDEAEMIAAHIEGIRAHVKREMEKGRLRKRGWKLVDKRKTYKWTNFDAVKRAAVKLGVPTKLLFNQKEKTPLQVKKALEGEGVELDFENCYSHSSSGTTLARQDDKREEVIYDPFDE